MNTQQAYTVLQKVCGINVGDTVRVLRKVNGDSMGWVNSWQDEMDELLNPESTAVVVSIDDGHGIKLDNGYQYPFFVLEVVESAFKPITVYLNEEYSATIYSDRIAVGCQTFAYDAIENLAQKLGEAKKLRGAKKKR